MTEKLKMRPIDQIPPDVRVGHVDELDWPAREHLSEFEENVPVEIDAAVAEAFEDYDVVKYTDFYEVFLDSAPGD